MTLDAIAQLFDQKMATLHASQLSLTSQFSSFHHDVHTRFQAHDVRMNAIEHQLANFTTAQANKSVDIHARESISRIEQQMKFLSISISSGSKSSNARDSKCDSANNTHADDRVSSEQLYTLRIGRLHIESGEDVCSKMVSKEIIALCHCTLTEIHSKGQFKGILWAKFESSSIRDRVT